MTFQNNIPSLHQFLGKHKLKSTLYYTEPEEMESKKCNTYNRHNVLKYGFTPCPKTIDIDVFEARLSMVSEEIKQLLLSWYSIDTNSLPKPQYVLRNLTGNKEKDQVFWDQYLTMVDALKELPFDPHDNQDLLVGHSVTEWEVREAFSDNPVDLKTRRDEAFAWSHRAMVGD